MTNENEKGLNSGSGQPMKSENHFLLQASVARQIPALIFENVVSTFIGFDQLCDHRC